MDEVEHKAEIRHVIEVGHEAKVRHVIEYEAKVEQGLWVELEAEVGHVIRAEHDTVGQTPWKPFLENGQ